MVLESCNGASPITPKGCFNPSSNGNGAGIFVAISSRQSHYPVSILLLMEMVLEFFGVESG